MKETKNKPKKNRTFMVGIAGAIIGSAITIGVTKYFSADLSHDKELVEKANEINKLCPMMIDENTRFDFISVFPGNKFQYNYTMVNADLGNIDTTAAKNFLIPNILSFAKTNPDMQFLRKNNTTLYYNYKDRNRNFLFKLTVLPEQYNKK